MLFFAILLAELIILFFSSRFITSTITRILMRITRRTSTTIHILSFIFLPGIIVHELSHILVAGVLLVPVGNSDFLPQIKDGRVKLGSVEIGKTDPIRRVLIGFAPVLFGFTIIVGSLLFWQPIDALWQAAVSLYIIFQIANTMFSSPKDMEGTVEILLVTLFLILAIYFAGFRVPVSFVESLFSEEHTVTFFKRVDILMLVPLILDGIVFAGVKLARW